MDKSELQDKAPYDTWCSTLIQSDHVQKKHPFRKQKLRW